jgi:hypothetical protein
MLISYRLYKTHYLKKNYKTHYFNKLNFLYLSLSAEVHNDWRIEPGSSVLQPDLLPACVCEKKKWIGHWTVEGSLDQLSSIIS